MSVAGVVIVVMSILLMLFPSFFLNFKSPDTRVIRMKKLNNNPKIKMCVRLWGMICLILGVALVISGAL